MCLLLVVNFAVEFPISEVASCGKRLLTHCALQTLLVPRRFVDPHQKSVGYRPLTSLADGLMMAFSTWVINEHLNVCTFQIHIHNVIILSAHTARIFYSIKKLSCMLGR